jgi:hypothetical protein
MVVEPVRVDKGSADCAMGPGDPDRPFCRISDAIASTSNDAVIVVRAAGTPYVEQVNWGRDDGLALLGDGQPIIQAPSGAVLRVEGDSEDWAYLYASGISLTQGTSGVSCDHGIVWLDDVRIAENQTGVRAEIRCDLHVRRSEIVLYGKGGCQRRWPSRGRVLDA